MKFMIEMQLSDSGLVFALEMIGCQCNVINMVKIDEDLF